MSKTRRASSSAKRVKRQNKNRGGLGEVPTTQSTDVLPTEQEKVDEVLPPTAPTTPEPEPEPENKPASGPASAPTTEPKTFWSRFKFWGGKSKRRGNKRNATKKRRHSRK